MPNEYWDLIDSMYKSGDPKQIALADKSIKDINKVTKESFSRINNVLYAFAAIALLIAFIAICH